MYYCDLEVQGVRGIHDAVGTMDAVPKQTSHITDPAHLNSSLVSDAYNKYYIC